MPKNVATFQAQIVFIVVWTFSCFCVRPSEDPSAFIRFSVAGIAAECQIFEDSGIEDRRTDLVDARGPFAEIDLAAAVAAERKVLVTGAHDHCAGGAVEQLGGFLIRSHGFVL